MTTQLPRDAPFRAPAEAVAASQPPRRADHRYYAWAGAAAFAIVFAGFARTYFLKFLFGAPELPWLLHLHGALMTSWFILFSCRRISSRRTGFDSIGDWEYSVR